MTDSGFFFTFFAFTWRGGTVVLSDIPRSANVDHELNWPSFEWTGCGLDFSFAFARWNDGFVWFERGTNNLRVYRWQPWPVR